MVEPVFRRGRQVGERRRYNDRLLMAAIRHLGPPRPRADTTAALTAALEALDPSPARAETLN